MSPLDFIDIVTQPGIGPVRGQTFYQLRDGDFTGRSPFTPVKGPEQLQNYGFNIGGGDGVFNDRPVGVARNTLRGGTQWNAFGYVAYTIPLHRRATPVTGVTATGFTGSAVSSAGTYSDTTRYRLTFALHSLSVMSRR